MAEVRLALESPAQDGVVAMLARADADMTARYPAESNHLLPIDELARPNVRFFVARRAGALVGCAALVVGAAGEAELKRMYVDPAARGLSIGRRLLQAAEAAARAEGVTVIRLETGIHQAEALGLYRASGYRDGGPFGAYQADPNSVFMEKRLD